jgi:hypothetical protein
MHLNTLCRCIQIIAITSVVQEPTRVMSSRDFLFLLIVHSLKYYYYLI